MFIVEVIGAASGLFLLNEGLCVIYQRRYV